MKYSTVRASPWAFSAALCLLSAMGNATSLPAPAALPVPNVLIEMPARLTTSVLQSTGKLVVAGDLTRANGAPVIRIARFRADGSVDPGWSSPAWEDWASVFALAVDSSDRIYVAGAFSATGGVASNGLIRLLPDGAVDPSWDPQISGLVSTIALDEAHGVIYAGGALFGVHGLTPSGLVKIPTQGDGTPDGSWLPTVEPSYNITGMVQNGGALYISGGFRKINGVTHPNLAKLDAGGVGTLDAPWAPVTGVGARAIAHDPVSGKLLVVGSYVGPCAGLSPVDESGTGQSDASWCPDASAGGSVSNVSVDAAARVVFVGGDFTTFGGVATKHAARVSLDGAGATDASWKPQFEGSVNRMQQRSDGKLYALGSFRGFDGQPYESIGLVDASGHRDPSFQGWATGDLSNLVYRSTRRAGGNEVYLQGSFTRVGGQLRAGMAKIVDGALDSAWSPTSVDALSVSAWQALPDGSGVIVSQHVGNGSFQLRKLDATTGAQVAGFTPLPVDGGVSAFAVDGDDVYAGGSFEMAGGLPRARLAKLSGTTGAIDPAWNPGANDRVRNIVFSAGQIYASGDFTALGGMARPGVGRLSSTGAGGVDAVWSPVLPVGSVQAIAPDPSNGAVFLAGGYLDSGALSRRGVARLDAITGALSASFDAHLGDPSGTQVLVDGHGGVLVAGYFSFANGVERDALVRLNASDGSLDTAWDPASRNHQGSYLLASTPGGAVELTGGFGTVGGAERTGLVRLPVEVARVTATSGGTDPSPPGVAYPVSATVAGVFDQPTGSLRFDDGHGNSCQAPLTGASATCTMAAPISGTVMVTVTYQPDVDAFSAATASFSHSVTPLADPVFGDSFE